MASLDFGLPDLVLMPFSKARRDIAATVYMPVENSVSKKRIVSAYLSSITTDLLTFV
ncbi:MAG: hypothetical protein ABSB12_00955 [Candidatus Saccharimonadales bacterium]